MIAHFSDFKNSLSVLHFLWSQLYCSIYNDPFPLVQLFMLSQILTIKSILITPACQHFSQNPSASWILFVLRHIRYIWFQESLTCSLNTFLSYIPLYSVCQNWQKILINIFVKFGTTLLPWYLWNLFCSCSVNYSELAMFCVLTEITE